jgi:hypothetical protein
MSKLELRWSGVAQNLEVVRCGPSMNKTPWKSLEKTVLQKALFVLHFLEA